MSIAFLLRIGSEVVAAGFAILTLGMLIIQYRQRKVDQRTEDAQGDPAAVFWRTEDYRRLDRQKLMLMLAVLGKCDVSYR